VLKLALSKDKVVLVHTLKALWSGGVTPLIMKLDPVRRWRPASCPTSFTTRKEPMVHAEYEDG